MKKLPLVPAAAAAALLVVGASASSAADLPTRQYAPPAPFVAAPAFTWTGFYAGVNAGYGFENNRNRNRNTYYGVTGPVYYGSSGSRGGFVGGGQLGYNYQFTPGSGLVVGVETDLQYAGIGRNRKTYVSGSPYAYGSSGSSGNYFGTVRGRLGYAFDRFMVYGTGGFAYGDVGRDQTYYGAPLATATYPYVGKKRGTQTGYAVGGGIEYAFTNHLSAKVEGLYVSLGSGSKNTYALATPVAYGTRKGREEFGVVRAGLNYKF